MSDRLGALEHKKLKECGKILVSNVDKVIEVGESAVKLCNYLHVYRHERISKRVSFDQGSATPSEIAKFSLKKDDVIITKDSETPQDIGVSTVVVDDIENLVCGYHLAIIRPNNEIVHGPFLSKALRSDSVKNQLYRMASGSTRFGLTLPTIENTVVSIPPLAEQKKIAKILSSIDRMIELTEARITHVGMLLEGVLNDILKPRPEWELKQLQQIVRADSKITYGIVQAGPHVADGVPYIRTGDMLKPDMNLSGFLRTSVEIDQEYSRSKVIEGDIVCALRGEVGRVIVVPKVLNGANLTQGTARISVAGVQSNKFVYWALQAQPAKEQFKRATKGTSLQEITLDALRKIEISFPKSIAEQKRLAKILDVISEQSKVLRGKLRSYKFVKCAIMNDLLSGRVRVKVNQ